MKTSLLVLASLLLLLLATRSANGIRLDRQLHEAINSKKEISDSKAGQPSSAAHAMNSSGKAKKTLAHAEPGAAKQEQQQGTKGSDDVTGRVVDEATPRSRPREPVHPRHTVTAAATYPDILDIAGMDYSPAARKPPIHN